MKLMIVAGILAVFAVFFVATKFKRFGKDFLKIYLGLIVVGILVALSFGPPRYVLLDDTFGTYRINDEKVVAFQGWELNRLLPFEAFAETIIFTTDDDGNDAPITHEQAGYPPLKAQFVVPGSALSRYLWPFLLAAFAVSVFLKNNLSRYYQAKARLGEARAKATVHAYEEFIKTHDKGYLRPRGLLKKARKEKAETYDRYLRRLSVLDAVNQRNSDAVSLQLTTDDLSNSQKTALQSTVNARQNYSLLLNVLMESIRHSRDKKAFEFDHVVSVEPGIFSKNLAKKYSDPVEILEDRLDYCERYWRKHQLEYGLPDIERIVGKGFASIEGFSTFAPEAMSNSREIVGKAVSEYVDPSTPSGQNAHRFLSNHAWSYAYNKYLLTLPVKDSWGQYFRIYKKCVSELLLSSLSRFVPDEVDENDKPGIFKELPAHPTYKALKISLVDSGVATTSGQELCDQKFTFYFDGDEIVSRFGAHITPLHKKRKIRSAPYWMPFTPAAPHLSHHSKSKRPQSQASTPKIHPPSAASSRKSTI